MFSLFIVQDSEANQARLISPTRYLEETHRWFKASNLKIMLQEEEDKIYLVTSRRRLALNPVEFSFSHKLHGNYLFFFFIEHVDEIIKVLENPMKVGSLQLEVFNFFNYTLVLPEGMAANMLEYINTSAELQEMRETAKQAMSDHHSVLAPIIVEEM